MARKSDPNTGIKIVSPDDPEPTAMHARAKGQTLTGLYMKGTGEFIVLLSSGAAIDVTYIIKATPLGGLQGATLFGIVDQPPVTESDILRLGCRSIVLENHESRELIGKSYLGYSEDSGDLLLFFSAGWRMVFRPPDLFIEHLNRKALQ